MNFECHITCTMPHSALAAAVAVRNHWKTSAIDGDPELGKHVFFYLTKHDEDYVRLHGHMKMTVGDLERAGVLVVREKIELIMHDVRRPV